MSVLFLMCVGVVVLSVTANRLLDSMNGWAFAAGMVSMVLAFFGAAFLAIASWFWVASEHEARLINQQLGTSYTREDLFFASGYIDEVREMHRNRVEINGDLMREDR